MPSGVKSHQSAHIHRAFSRDDLRWKSNRIGFFCPLTPSQFCVFYTKYNPSFARCQIAFFKNQRLYMVPKDKGATRIGTLRSRISLILEVYRSGLHSLGR